MRDPSLAGELGVYEVLRSGLAQTIGVWDEVPTDAQGRLTAAAFPYVLIGDDQVVSEANQCHDVSSFFPTVQVFSRKPGWSECKTIMADVVRLLDALIPIAGFQVVTVSIEDGPRYFTDADGKTRRGVVTPHYRLGPV